MFLNNYLHLFAKWSLRISFYRETPFMSGSLLIKSSSDADTSAINVLVGAELYHVFARKGEQGLDEVCLIAGNGYRIIVGILYFIADDVGVGAIVERHSILNAYGA